MATIEDGHVVLLRHLVDSCEEAQEVLFSVDILLSVGTQQNILSLLQSKSLMDITGFNLSEVVAEYLCHRAAGDVGALPGKAGIGQISSGVLAVGHIHIADDVHDAAVGLLGQAFVLAAVAGFHVEDGDVQALGADDAQATVGVSQHQHGIRLYLNHQPVALCDDVAHCLPQIIAYGFHIDVRILQFKVLEENTVEVVVVVLAGVRQEAVEILAAFIDYRCETDNLRAGADNNQELEFSVILELCHILYLTGSKKVSGFSGLNISLQYITVTRFSVSERLMMLCV